MSNSTFNSPPQRTTSRRPSIAQVESPTALSPVGTPPIPLPGSHPSSISSITPAAAPFPSRTTSRPQIKRTPTYDYSIPTPPQEFSETFAPLSSGPEPVSPPSNVGASGSSHYASHTQSSATNKPGWDALRRKVLPTSGGKAAQVAGKVWPVLNPANHSELIFPSSSGRETPTFFGGPRSSTPTTGAYPTYGQSGGRATPTTRRTLDTEGSGVPGSSSLARLVGAAGKVGGRRKGKRRAEPSVAQRFALELNQVDALFRHSSESATSGEGLALAAQGIANNGVSSAGGAGGGGVGGGGAGRRRAGSDANKLNDAANASHQADPVQALRLLEGIMDRYRPTGSVPDQTAVLSLLARPFVYASGRAGGEVDKFEEAVADLALAAFERFANSFAPGDAEEELERWKWLMKAMEVRSDDLRTRIAGLIRHQVNPSLYPSHWSHLTSSVTLHSLLAALMNLTHHLHFYPTPSTASLHARVVRDLIDQLATGALFAPSAAHFALTLSLPANSFETLTRERLSQLVVFDGLLLIAVGASAPLLEWLLAGEGTDLIVRYWVDEGVGALMRARLLSLFARACHRLLSSPLASSTTTRPASNDIFAPNTEAHEHLDSLKPALLHTLSSFYPLASVQELSPTIRGRLVYAHLAFFSSLSSTAYQLREWPPPISHTGMTKQVHEAKLWVAEAWRVDRAGAQEAVRSAVRELASLEAVAGVVGVCTMGMRDDATNESFAGAVLGTLFERVTSEAGAGESSQLLALLRLLANRHPTTFFKPLFTLSSTTSPVAVRTALSTVLTLSQLLGSSYFLLRDPEMMAVALLADPSSATSSKDATSQPLEKTSSTFDEPGWAPVRLGQLALLLEIELALQRIRTRSDTPKLEWESAVRFAEGFESRFAVFLAQRERSSCLPFSQRTLIAGLLFELRMLAKPTSRPIWLNRVIIWARSSRIERVAHFEPKKTASTSLAQDGSSLPSYYAPQGAQVTARVVSEPLSSFRALAMLYEDAHRLLTEPEAFKRRSAAARASVLSPGSRPRGGAKEELGKVSAKRLEERQKAILELKWDPLEPALKLLVAVHSVLAEQELVKLLDVAWDALDPHSQTGGGGGGAGGSKTLVAPAAFLVGLCGEKMADLLGSQISADSRSSDPSTRASLVRRLTAIFAQRHSLVLQPSADPKRRKPFKVARQQLSFVPLEVGSSDYVPSEPIEDASVHLKAGSMPPEVRRALTELGWDDRTEEQTVTERQRRPLSLLPWNEAAAGVEGGGGALDAPSSPAKSPQRLSLHRGNSANSIGKMGGYLASGKARPIVTLNMARNLLRLTELLDDTDGTVASTARSALLAFLRDEPILLLAPVLLELSGSVADQARAVRQIRLLLGLQTNLPPGVTHRLFNHLGGLLKTFSRGENNKHASKTLLPLMTTVLPSAAAIAPIVSDFSLRDLRKNKVEPLFLSNGAFWFNNDHKTIMALPAHRPEQDTNPFSTLGVDSTTFRVALVRIAQSNLQGGYVAKVPREAYAIKKNWATFELPFARETNALDFSFKAEHAREKLKPNEVALSALVARAWLLSLQPVVGGLSRNFNVRAELATVFSAVSSILLTHGRDTNLVGLSLRLCMTASTRFRRLFASSNGFGLFMPALFNVFVGARAEGNSAIRGSILYACQRFSRAHEESFVFQALGALSPTFESAQLDAEGMDTRPELARDLFAIIETLQMPAIDVADVAGIRGENEREERDALIHQANDRPDVFLASFGVKEEGREKSEKEERKENARLASAIGQGKPFEVESAIKLFLTVIAFDPTSGRAREFLNVFHHLVPSFYNSSKEAAALLAEGIAALANVFAKPGGRRALLPRTTDSTTKGPPPSAATEEDDEKLDTSSEGVTWLLMRRSYLQVVEAFHSCGGEISAPLGMKRVLEIVRATMREPNSASTKASSSTLATYTLSVLGPKAHPDKVTTMAFLSEMAPLLRRYWGQVDFATLYDALARVRTDSALKDDAQLAEFVTRKILGPALESCASSAGGAQGAHPAQPAIRLFAIWTTHPLSDALTEMERQPATAVFLADFVFPLAVQLANPPRLGGHAQREMDSPEGRERRRLVWMRVLGYAMRSTASPISGGVIGNAERKEREGRRWAARKTIALEVIKVALVAAEDELDKTPGAWLKLASFFRGLLATAGSGFLKDWDPNPPQANNVFFQGLSNPWAPASHHHSPVQQQPAQVQKAPPPTVTLLDRAAWSVFFLLASYPSPLVFHLRLFIREKLVGARVSSGAGRPPRKESLASLERRRGSSIFALPLLGAGSSRNGSASSAGLGVMGLPLRRERSASQEGGNLSAPTSPDPEGLLGGGRRRSSANSGGRRRSSATSGTPFQPTLEVFARDYLPIASATAPPPPPTGAGLSASTSSGALNASLGRRGSTIPGGGGLGPISAPRPINLSSSFSGLSGGASGQPGQVPTLASTRAERERGAGGWARAVVREEGVARETVRHVRTVQVVFGETPIELPQDEEEDEDGEGVKVGDGGEHQSLTKAQALRKVREEMVRLVEEFADVWEGAGAGGGGALGASVGAEPDA